MDYKHWRKIKILKVITIILTIAVFIIIIISLYDLIDYSKYSQQENDPQFNGFSIQKKNEIIQNKESSFQYFISKIKIAMICFILIPPAWFKYLSIKWIKDGFQKDISKKVGSDKEEENKEKINMENVRHFMYSLRGDITFDKGLQWKYTFTIIAICFGFIAFFSQKIIKATITAKYVSIILLFIINICFLVLMIISHKTMKKNRNLLNKLFTFFLWNKKNSKKSLGSFLDFEHKDEERQTISAIYF